MFKLYESKEWNTKQVTKESLEKCTGKNYNEWLPFTGFLDENLKSTLLNAEEVQLKGNFSLPILYYPLPELRNYELRFQINIDVEDLEIRNFDVFLKRRGEKLGLQAHKRQIKIAREFEFQFIYLRAFGGKNDPTKKFNGHVTWAKFGYTMQKRSQEKFEKQMRRDKKKASTLQELLLQEGGEDYWFNEGFEWNGEFDLKEDSINQKILNDYSVLVGQ